MKLNVPFAALAVGLAACLYVHNAVAAPPRFVALGDLGGGGFRSEARGVSADGTIVVGVSNSGSHPTGEAFRWTSTGMVGLGSISGEFSEANEITSNGAVIVGTSNSGSSDEEAFVWTLGSGFQALGFIAGSDTSLGFDVAQASGGEIFATGFSEGPGGLEKQAFRWRSSTGVMAGLGFAGGFQDSRGLAISSEGTRIAGFLGEIGFPVEAFRWTSSSGTMSPLGVGAGGTVSDGRGISADGTIVVGTTDFAVGTRAFRFLAGTPELVSLGTLLGRGSSQGFGASDDGKTVVGTSGGAAFLWNADVEAENPGQGMVDIKAALEGAGIDLTGWTLILASDVAADGRTVIGTGINPDGALEGWLATLPSPGETAEPRPIATGSDFACLLSAGAMGCWGNFPAFPDPGGSSVGITAGQTHVCAIRQTGVADCFGTDGGTGKTFPPAGVVFTDLSAGGTFTCGVTDAFELLCFGIVPGIQPPLGKIWSRVGSSLEHACAVAIDGSVECFGADTLNNGKTTVPPLLGSAKRVDAGDQHTCVVLSDDTLACFGEGTQGEPTDFGQADPLGGTFHIVRAAGTHTCATRIPDTEGGGAPVRCFGLDTDGQSSPPEFQAVALDTGGDTTTGFSCGLGDDDFVRCWGDDDMGRRSPPGDLDFDGFPEPIDNCPGLFNPEQEDADGDMIGDDCDKCIDIFDGGMDPTMQPDDDDDGLGDACDPCRENPNPECDPLGVSFVPDEGAGGGLGAGDGGAGAGAGLQEFQVRIKCGSTLSISQIGMAVAVPASVNPNTIFFANGCTSAGCPPNDAINDPPTAELPEGRLRDRITADRLTSGGLDATFVLPPQDPDIPMGSNPNNLYFSLRANDGETLCVPGEADPGHDDVFLAEVTIGDLVTGETPPLTRDGAEQAVGEAATDDNGNAVEQGEIEIASGDLTPNATITLTPAIKENASGHRFYIQMDANLELDRVLVALTGQGQLSIVGCGDFVVAGDACISELPRFNCSETGSVDPDLIGTYIDLPSEKTFVMGPVDDTVDLSNLDGVTSNTLFFSAHGKRNVAQGSRHALNPGEASVSLGTVEFIPDNPPTSGLLAAVITFSGVQTIFQPDRANACVDDPDFAFFQATLGPAFSFGAGDAASVQNFAFGFDDDDDGIPNNWDPCEFVADDGLDTGRLETYNSDGSVKQPGESANGVGNSCECAAVIGAEGAVKLNDREAIQDILLNNPPQAANLDLCSNTGTPDCEIDDWGSTVRAQLELGQGLGSQCTPAQPQ